MIKVTFDEKEIFAWVQTKEIGKDKLSVLLHYSDSADSCKLYGSGAHTTPSLSSPYLPGAIVIPFPKDFSGGMEGYRKAAHALIVKYIKSLKIKDLTKTEIIL
jgi:hypothetical protein